MNFYPELTQSIFLQLARLLTNSGDIFQNGCDLTAYLFTDYHEAVCVKPISREDVIREAHFDLFEPDIPAPYPGVILFHGSSPAFSDSMIERKNIFLKNGFAVMIVDSFTHTRVYEDCQSIGTHCAGLSHSNKYLFMPPDQCPAIADTSKINREITRAFLSWASEGKIMLPGERTHEFFEAIQTMRKHPHIKADQLTVVGYSHGGSVVLDALSLVANNLPPPGGKHLPENPLEGVNSAIVYYPNCRPGCYFEDLRSTPDIPVLMLLADHDELVSPTLCQEVVDDINQRKEARFITTARFDGGHAFDMTEYPEFDETLKNEAYNHTLSFIKHNLNECQVPEVIPPSYWKLMSEIYSSPYIHEEFDCLF